MKQNYIVGILELFSKLKFPRNKKNIPRYIFKPFDRDEYEYLLIASKSKKKFKTNIIILAKYLKKDSQYKYGEIVKIIGSIDSKENLYDSILYNYALINKKQYIQYKKRKELRQMLILHPKPTMFPTLVFPK